MSKVELVTQLELLLYLKPGEPLDGSGPSSLRRPRTGGVHAVLVSDQLLGQGRQEGASKQSNLDILMRPKNWSFFSLSRSFSFLFFLLFTRLRLF